MPKGALSHIARKRASLRRSTSNSWSISSSATAALAVPNPSPTTAAWNLGPIPIRAYALCIVLGIVAACYITERRMRARGAPPYLVLDVAIWAVPLGILGAIAGVEIPED